MLLLLDLKLGAVLERPLDNVGVIASALHPLAGLPGPLYLRCSKLIGTIIYARTGRQHEYFRRLHEDYGPVVRVGPNEVSICDAGAVKSVLGAEGLPKGKCESHASLIRLATD